MTPLEHLNQQIAMGVAFDKAVINTVFIFGCDPNVLIAEYDSHTQPIKNVA